MQLREPTNAELEVLARKIYRDTSGKASKSWDRLATNMQQYYRRVALAAFTALNELIAARDAAHDRTWSPE